MQKSRHRHTRSGIDRGSVYVDTSAWIAFLSARDQNHRDAERLIRAAIAHRVVMITTNLVLAEVHRLILHRVGARAAALALDWVESSAHVEVMFANEIQHLAAKVWLNRKTDRRVSYTDAVGFTVIEERCGGGYLGFDSDFADAGFRPWIPG